MGKTQQQYKEEIYAAGKKSVDKLHSQKKKTDAETLKQINAAIDESAATQTGQYQQRIEAAPLESRVEYDQNAVNDAVSKKRIQETLANMGVTDSGLTSGMQTALAIQKQKADRSVKVNENAKIQAAQAAIDGILADAETKKADAKIQRENDTANWYANALAELENSSNQSAAEAYAADQEYAAKVYDSQQKYNAQLISDQNTAAEKQSKAIQDAVDADVESGVDATVSRQVNGILLGGDAKKKALYEQALGLGCTTEEALLFVNAGGGTAGVDAISGKAEQNAATFLSKVDLDATGWKTFWRNETADANIVESAINNVLASDAYKNLTYLEKAEVKPKLVGACIATSWSKKMDASDNATRLKLLCEKFGITERDDIEDAVKQYNALYSHGGITIDANGNFTT